MKYGGQGGTPLWAGRGPVTRFRAGRSPALILYEVIIHRTSMYDTSPFLYFC